MALTLSRVMQRCWREMGMLSDIQATGGSVTTVVDTNSRFTSDDALVNGTAIVVRDAGGASAAPEGEFSTITDYVASTKTFTINTLTAAVASGDWIGLAKSTIPAYQMVQAINDGIRDLGNIPLVDTSITTVSGQSEYTLPVGLKYGDPYDILIQGSTDTDDNQYESVKGQCRIFPAAAGSAGMLEARGLPVGYKLKIVYRGVHDIITAHSSVINETISERLAVAAGIDKALTWLVSKRGDSALGTFILQRWNDAKQQLSTAKIEAPKMNEKNRIRFFSMGYNNWNDKISAP